MRLKFYKCIGTKQKLCGGWEHMFEVDKVYPSFVKHKRDDVLLLSTKKDESKYYVVDADQFVEVHRYHVAVHPNGYLVEHHSEPTESQKQHMDFLVKHLSDNSNPFEKPNDKDGLAVLKEELTQPDITPERVDEILDLMNKYKKQSCKKH